jgi:hypothetical protein
VVDPDPVESVDRNPETGLRKAKVPPPLKNEEKKLHVLKLRMYPLEGNKLLLEPEDHH